MSYFRLCTGRRSPVSAAFLLAAAALLSLHSPAIAQDNIASLRIADETAPAGGVAQIKVELTEPRPIIIIKSTVRSTSQSAQLRRFSVPLRAIGGGILGSFRGARAFSASGRHAGAATIINEELRLQILSPDGQLGMALDTPLLTISADVQPAAAGGASTSLDLGLGAVTAEMPGGQLYGTEVKTGTLSVGGVSINRISPAGDFIAAGTELTIHGSGFQPGGELDINEVATTPAVFVSSTELRAVAQQGFSLNGRRIRWRNPDNVRDEFFAVSPMPQSSPGTSSLIANTMPLFGTDTVSSVRVDYPVSAGIPGLAVENPGKQIATVTIRGLQGSVPVPMQATRTLPPGGVRTEDIATLFGTANHGVTAVTVEADQPVRVIGLVADTAQSVVDPIFATDAPIQAISLNAAVDGASFLGGGIAPGEIVSLFGGPFLSGPSAATRLPLPIELGGISVTMNGVHAPLFFVGQDQINCVAPLGLAGTDVVIRVHLNGEAKASLTVPRKNHAPGIFTFDFTGTGPGVIAENSTGRVVQPGAPLRTGDFAVIYCTGLGSVTNPPAAGDGAAVSPLSETLAMPAVNVGGVPAPVLFSGLAPGFAGLYQVNVSITDQLPRGASVPVQLFIGGVPSNVVTTVIE